MADVLPADLVVLYQDAFAHFDSLKNGMISTKLLGPLLRHCGENPSESEIQVRFLFSYEKAKIYSYLIVLIHVLTKGAFTNHANNF